MTGAKTDKQNPDISDKIRSNRNAIIERNLIKRVFYGNARGLSERRMSPKVKFMKRSYEINPYTLNDRISDKDKFSYYYKSKYAITESNLIKGVNTIAGFNPRYKY